MSEYYEGLQISIQTITHVLNSRGWPRKNKSSNNFFNKLLNIKEEKYYFGEDLLEIKEQN